MILRFPFGFKCPRRVTLIMCFVSCLPMVAAGENYAEVGTGISNVSMKLDGFDEITVLETYLTTSVNGSVFMDLKYKVEPGAHGYIESGVDLWDNAHLGISYMGGPSSKSKYENFAVSLLPMGKGLYVKVAWQNISGQAVLRQRDINSVVQVTNQNIDTKLSREEIGWGFDWQDGKEFSAIRGSIGRSKYEIPQIVWTSHAIPPRWAGDDVQEIHYSLGTKEEAFYGLGGDIKCFYELNSYHLGEETFGIGFQHTDAMYFRKGKRLWYLDLYVYAAIKSFKWGEVNFGVAGFMQRTQTDTSVDDGKGQLLINGWGPTAGIKFLFK